MVLYTEQNYEGFTEGFTDAVTGLTVYGEYAAGVTDIMLKYDIDQHDKIHQYVSEINAGNYDIVNATLFDEQTRIISSSVEGLHIELSTAIPSSKLTSSAETDIIIQSKDDNDSFVNAATGKFQIDQSNTNENISSFIMSTDNLSYLSVNGNDATLTDIVNGDDLQIQLADDSTVTYSIQSSKLIVSVTLSSGIKSGVTGNTNDQSVTIADHSHTHDHTDGFEGLENKSQEEDEDEKEGDETKDAIKNIMDNLDIDGIIDIVKKGSDKKEGFFSAEKKNVGEVAGAFAGESYESEITGVAECTTTICERIHREEQLIRPVNSNEELQRV